MNYPYPEPDQLHVSERSTAHVSPIRWLLLPLSRAHRWSRTNRPRNMAMRRRIQRDRFARPSVIVPVPIEQQLAQELLTTRSTLEATIAELQATNSELSAANEELHTLNEELRVANEAFQSAEAEVQSVNAAMQTINADLNQKVAELDRANSELRNLFVNTPIPMLFLQQDGRITRFTPAATAVFQLSKTDIGRAITDISPRFCGSDLAVPIATVLHTLTPYEALVCNPTGDTWWMMRIRPYRTIANLIDGVVITFSDITELKRVEAEREQLLKAVQRARSYAERVVETVHESLLILDENLRVQSANRAFYRTFQMTPAETEQHVLYELNDRQWDTPQLHRVLGERLNQHSTFEGVEMTLTFSQIGTKTLLLHAHPIEPTSDRPMLILLAIEDITERAQTLAALQQAYAVLDVRVQERTLELMDVNAALELKIHQHKQAERSRQLLLQQLVTAQEEERRRIARELHDQMGQDLTVLMLGLKALCDAAPGDSMIPAHVEPLQAVAMRIGREMRTLALQLRPPALDDLGLAAALANYVEQWSARTLIAVDFHTIGMEAQRLPSLIETALYRLTLEALTNVLKHAQATNVSVIIEQRTDAVHMIVEDNGGGFDVEATRRDCHAERHLGLIGMDERVVRLGGTLILESSRGNGTTVFVRIPLSKDTARECNEPFTDFSGR